MIRGVIGKNRTVSKPCAFFVVSHSFRPPRKSISSFDSRK